jgi:hypothetical protein
MGVFHCERVKFKEGKGGKDERKLESRKKKKPRRNEITYITVALGITTLV